MQKVRQRFQHPDGAVDGSLQACVRTNDLELVGDGTHLTSFQMLGNFSFGGLPYAVSCEMWLRILADLGIAIDAVHVHPSRGDHKRLWAGQTIVEDADCIWSDGQIGGHCCEIYSRGIEIGNLVNPLEHSTDVGFGFERLVMLLEGKSRADETSLFDPSLDPIVRDHVRTLRLFHANGIVPGAKGRNYICRVLLRRVLDVATQDVWTEWVEEERKVRANALRAGRKLWRKHKDKSAQWWYETCGLLKSEFERQ